MRCLTAAYLIIFGARTPSHCQNAIGSACGKGHRISVFRIIRHVFGLNRFIRCLWLIGCLELFAVVLRLLSLDAAIPLFLGFEFLVHLALFFCERILVFCDGFSPGFVGRIGSGDWLVDLQRATENRCWLRSDV